MKSLRIFAAMIFGGGLLLASSAQAIPVLDQATGAPTTHVNPPYRFAQEVTAGMSGQLLGIRLYGVPAFTDGGAANTFGRTSNFVRIAHGNVFSHGSFLFNSLVDLSAGSTYIDVSGSSISVTAGQQFIIDFGGAANQLISGGAVQPTSYSGGDFFIFADGTTPLPLSVYNIVLAFETYVDGPAANAPSPGALALLSLGLAGVGVTRRRKTA